MVDPSHTDHRPELVEPNLTLYSLARQVFTFVGMLVPACILMIAPITTDDHYVFYGMLVLAYAISGSVFSGFRVSQMELAPNFVAAITAVGDLVGSFAMNFTHTAFIVGFGAISEQYTWNEICWYLSAMLVICASPFIFLGSSEVQPWNEEVVSVPANSESDDVVV